MISQTTLLILGGCLLGAIQLVLGIALGLCLRGRDRARHRRQEMLQAAAIAQRLQKLVDEMSYSAHQHRSQLDRASQMLALEHGPADEPLAELVVGVIGEVLRANQTLQSRLESAESRLEEQATEIEDHISRSLTDPLTGLPNRREFDNRLEERMTAWDRSGAGFSLLLVDVDHFKRLNDEHGHLAGDAVLAAIGRALRSALRGEDAVARYGGEEFAILLPTASLDRAIGATQRVRVAVARVAVQHNGQKIRVTSSGGLAIIEPYEAAESLIQRADAALYSAKAAGRNCTFIHYGNDCHPVTDLQVQLLGLEPWPGEPMPALADKAGHQPQGGREEAPGGSMSVELAKTCEMLRRFVAGCDAGQQSPAPDPGRR